MPTATEFWGFNAHNLGPLTTTFTAPSSCATGTDHHVFVNASEPIRIFGVPTCGPMTFGDCIPSASLWESIHEQTTEFVQGQYAYFSPGLACPSGWSTVGTLAHGGDGDDKASASGALESPDWDEFMNPSYLHPTDDYRADAFGQCVSTIGPTESYTYSEMCLTFNRDKMLPVSTWDGTTLTDNRLASFASATDEPMTTLDDLFLTGTAVDGYLAIATYVPAVQLVYKESDKEDSKDEDKEGDDKDEEDDNDSGDGNSASATTPRSGVVSVLGITLGLLAGAGMLL
ncbi:hypothetical protein ACHAPY_000063 [Fusarium culmorum]|uniref:Uncharacterized protein n=1 Tax=Fusarium culmorum TaxID=5516 RepID=A0A2T4H6T8_FUSCU|nr:hypothetical protein FCULG_00005090 [Fusarium culmorum]